MKKMFFCLCLFGVFNISYAQKVKLSAQDSIILKNYYFDGLSDRIREDYKSAEANFNEVLKIDSLNDAALYELANIQIRQNKLLIAEISIKKAIEIQPLNLWYLRLLGDIYKLNRNMEQLLVVLDKIIELDTAQSSGYFDRVNTLIILGKNQVAEEELKRIESKFGNSKKLSQFQTYFRNKTNSISSIEHQLSTDTDDYTVYLKIASELFGKQKYNDALTVLQKAQKIAPDNYEVNIALAHIYQILKKYDSTFTSLQTAFAQAAMPVSLKLKMLEKMPEQGYLSEQHIDELNKLVYQQYAKDANVMVYNGDLHYQKGEYRLAKENYKKAIELNDQLYVAWEKLLALEVLLSEYTAAIKTGETALALYPNQAILYYYRAFALHRNQQNAEANLEIKNVLSLEVEDDKLKAMIFALQAEVFIDQGKFRDAENTFEKSIELAPNNFLNRSNYAYFLALRNHDLQKAETLAVMASKNLSQDAAVQDTYAFVLFKRGKFSAALKVIELVLQLKGGQNPVYIEHYGDILYMNGNNDAALKAWQSAREAGNRDEKLNRKINEKKYIK